MKKISSYIIMVIMLFSFLIPSTFALTNNEAKTEIVNYANSLNTIKEELEQELNSFRLWTNKYSDDLKIICTRDFLYNLIVALDNEDYNLFIDLLIQGLENNDMVSSSDRLKELKPDFLNAINKLNDFENELYTFLDENHDVILVSDLLPLINTINNTYTAMRSPIKKVIDVYYDIYINYVTENFKTNEEITLESIDILLNNFEIDIVSYDKFLTIFDSKMAKWQSIADLYDLKQIGFENLLKEDIKPYLKKSETMFTEIYNNYVSKKINSVKTEYDKMIDSSDLSNEDKNNKLSEKVKEIEKLYETVTQKLQALKSNISKEELLNQIKKIENSLNTDINEVISYLKKLSIVEDYDIDLSETGTNKDIEIDRFNNLIIVQNSYSLKSFMLYLKLINGLGELKVDNTYNQKIGTKSILGIYKDNIVQKLYHIILKGDVSENGVIDISDVTYLIKTVLTEKELEEYQMIAGDMNNDKIIDISDITATIKKALN